MKCIKHLVAVGWILANLASTAAAQQASPLSLNEALAIALEKSPAHKLALAGVRLAAVDSQMARAVWLPRLDARSSATAGDDPVYAFGTRLRQGRFAQADFALTRLNHPAAIGDLSGGASAQWNLPFNAPLQTRAARFMQLAAQKDLTRSDQELIYRVAASYAEVMQAARELQLAEQTRKTADALVADARSRVDAGAAVEADLLLAKVNLAAREEQRAQAFGARRMRWAELEEQLGAALPEERMPEAVDAPVRAYDVAIEEAVDKALRLRPERERIELQTCAQRDQSAAQSWRHSATLSAYGSWRLDASPSSSANGRAWMTGVELRLPIFDATRSARKSAEQARMLQTAAQGEALAARLRAEVKKAVIASQTAQQSMALAQGSVAEAEESLRIVRDRYESGLATMTDLLRAEDAAQSSRVNYWRAAEELSLRHVAALLATGEITAVNAQEAITGGLQ